MNNIKEEELENFFILPPKEYFDVNVINTFKEASSLSMRHISDIFLLYLMLFAAFFTDKNQLIVNSVYLTITLKRI